MNLGRRGREHLYTKAEKQALAHFMDGTQLVPEEIKALRMLLDRHQRRYQGRGRHRHLRVIA